MEIVPLPVESGIVNDGLSDRVVLDDNDIGG